MDSDGKITCDVCRKFGWLGGSVGLSELCIDCYNKFDADQSRAKSAERVAGVLQKRNDALSNQNVLMDQQLEQDSRLVEARAEVKRLQGRVWMLEQRVLSLGGTLDFTSPAPPAAPEPPPQRSEE